MKNKKYLLGIVVFLMLLSVFGVSFALWQFSDSQNTFDTLGTKCFNLTISNASSGIHLNKISPTSDEEGKKDAGYTFTITNTCNTKAAYQVNLEELVLDVKRLSNKYIKISLNDSDGKVLNTYEEVTKTIDNADVSHKLTSGSLKPDESVTYNLKLWMDEDTPAIDEVINAAFESKVTVIANYKEDITNKLETTIVTKNESFSKDEETIDVTVTSELYDIIEVSDDGITYNPVARKGKTVTVTKNFNREGIYKIYFKDEMGNIKEQTIETTKLDQTVPSVEIAPTDNQETIRLSIKLNDVKSGLSGYKITEDSSTPTEWNPLSSNEETVDFTLTENKTYYVWVKDKVGNVTYEAYSASTIDTTAPTLEVKNTLTSWGEKDSIEVAATDDLIGLSGVSISNVENEYHWELIENSPLEYSHTFEVTENGTYYVSVKDAYNHITTKSIVIDKIDKTLPNINNLTAPTEWGIKNTVSAVVQDNESGIVGYAWSTSSDIPSTFVEVTKTNEEQTYINDYTENTTVYFFAKDAAGNIGSRSIAVNKVDTEIPIAKISASASGGNITVSATDSSDSQSGMAKYYYSKDNGATWVSSVDKSYTFVGLSAGEYSLALKVEDNVGRLSEIVTTKAIIYPLATDYLENLAVTDTTNFAYDGTEDNNLRYIGMEPNNYVKFNDELWRVIGVMNNIDDGTGKLETRVKIIRETPYNTSVAWNNNSGILSPNSSSELLSFLSNIEDDSIIAAPSISGSCNVKNNESVLLNDLNENYYNSFNETAKKMVDNSKWYFSNNMPGSGGTEFTNATTSKLYEFERKGETTTTIMTYITEYNIKIGVLYLSDYGYASSGSGDIGFNRETCLSEKLYFWYDFEYGKWCSGTSWLRNSSYSRWTLSGYLDCANFVLTTDGSFASVDSASTAAAIPVLHLKSNVRIISGTGANDNPFILSV